MTADDLSTPLGQQVARRRRRQLPISGMRLLALLLGLFLTVFAGFAIFYNDPLGGEPVARLALQATAAGPTAAAAPKTPNHEAATAAKAALAPATGQRTITIIDGTSGARQNVVVGAGAATDQSATDQSAADQAAGAAAPALMAGINPRLLEKSRYGMIPVAADGLTSFAAYSAATDADRARAATMPAIAIVIGGLGVGAARTAAAIMDLPGAVTLAFTPYGADPGKLIERARAQHHEVLLQLPMEPFDYPDNDPGPQTLLTTLSTEQNIDRLFWHLSRFQGYVGVASFMGARFVASDAAMQPILHEAATRGLGYFDDGASPRSVAGSLAEGQALPFAKADVRIDGVPTAAEIDQSLADLESLAKKRGYAIGVASSLPAAVARIAAWAKTLSGRGITLAPLTAVMAKSKSNSIH